MIEKYKRRCKECDWHGELKDILVGPNPFELGHQIEGCPSCHAPEQFVSLCDQEFCKRDADCGWPSPEGYRRTCGEHWKR